MASRWSLHWLLPPAYLYKLRSRRCLALLRCDVLSRMPSQLEELMWQVRAGEKKKKKSCFSSSPIFALCCHAAGGAALASVVHSPEGVLHKSESACKETGGFWRWHVESCHRSSRNLFCKSRKSWPGAHETTVLVKYKVITLNSLSAICIFNNFSSERCPVPTGIFASICSWLLI